MSRIINVVPNKVVVRPENAFAAELHMKVAQKNAATVNKRLPHLIMLIVEEANLFSSSVQRVSSDHCRTVFSPRASGHYCRRDMKDRRM